MTEPDTREPECHAARDGDAERPAMATRRWFLSRLSAGLASAAALLAGVPLVGYFFSPVIRSQPQAWRAVGGVDQFPVGDTVMVRYLDPDPVPWAGFAGRSAAWLRRDAGDRLTAFSSYCTHAGCPVSWSSGAQMFMCPCHGGVFHRDGSVAAGPPPRPLERLPVRLRDGQVEILTIGAPRTEA